MRKKKKRECFGVNENLYAIRDVMDRLYILRGIINSGNLEDLRNYLAFSDIAQSILDHETDCLEEIIKDLNEHFPDQAIDLDPGATD